MIRYTVEEEAVADGTVPEPVPVVEVAINFCLLMLGPGILAGVRRILQHPQMMQHKQRQPHHSPFSKHKLEAFSNPSACFPLRQLRAEYGLQWNTPYLALDRRLAWDARGPPSFDREVQAQATLPRCIHAARPDRASQEPTSESGSPWTMLLAGGLNRSALLPEERNRFQLSGPQPGRVWCCGELRRNTVQTRQSEAGTLIARRLRVMRTNAQKSGVESRTGPSVSVGLIPPRI